MHAVHRYSLFLHLYCLECILYYLNGLGTKSAEITVIDVSLLLPWQLGLRMRAHLM